MVEKFLDYLGEKDHYEQAFVYTTLTFDIFWVMWPKNVLMSGLILTLYTNLLTFFWKMAIFSNSECQTLISGGKNDQQFLHNVMDFCHLRGRSDIPTFAPLVCTCIKMRIYWFWCFFYKYRRLFCTIVLYNDLVLFAHSPAPAATEACHQPWHTPKQQSTLTRLNYKRGWVFDFK